MLQTIRRVQLITHQQIGCYLASKQRNQVWVDIIGPPWASAVIILALKVIILALEAIPESLDFLVQDGYFELEHTGLPPLRRGCATTLT